MVHLDNSRSGFTCSMRNFLELSPNDWGTKRTICEMDLNRWFPREKHPMILLSQNPRIFGSYIYIHIFVYVLLHQKDILLIHYQSYHNESLSRVFPQTHWREVFYPWSRLSCSAWLIGDSKIDLPHKSLLEPLFMSTSPFEQAPISENHTNNIQQQVKAYEETSKADVSV